VCNFFSRIIDSSEALVSYGTAGHALITSELLAMFPDGSLDLESMTPLSRTAVIEEFLFPETVVLLLQEELRVSYSEILQILWKKNLGNTGRGSKVQPHLLYTV